MKILVLGEICEDIFVYGDCERLNPEAPTPIIKPIKYKYNYGMAANTINNFKNLGVKVDFIDDDDFKLKKIRYVDSVSNYILLRVDENEHLVKPINFKKIEKKLKNNYDAVAISDYNKGYLTEESLYKIFNLTSEKNIPTFIDTKKEINEKIYDNVTYIKINKKEYTVSKKYIDKWYLSKTIITLGGEGAMLDGEVYPTEKVDVRDVVGAGDTFLSALVYKYLKTNDIRESIKFANELSTDVVQKRGVALPTIK